MSSATSDISSRVSFSYGAAGFDIRESLAFEERMSLRQKNKTTRERGSYEN
jgi:hypothetical protein